MPSATYISKRGVDQTGYEVTTLLVNSASGAVSGVELYSSPVWYTVNASVSVIGNDVQVTSNTNNGYGSITLVNLIVGQQYQVKSNVTIGSGFKATISIVDTSNLLVTKTTTSSGVLTLGFIASSSTLDIRFINYSSGINAFDNISITEGFIDVSGSQSPAQVIGNLNLTEVNTGAELQYLSGFSLLNYVEQGYSNSNIDYATSNTPDFYFSFWMKLAENTAGGLGYILDRSFIPGSAFSIYTTGNTGLLSFSITDNSTNYDICTSTSKVDIDVPLHITCVHRTLNTGLPNQFAVLEIWINSVLNATINVLQALNILTNNNAKLTIGTKGQGSGLPFQGSLCLVKTAPYAPLLSDIDQMYTKERLLFNPYSRLSITGQIYSIDIRYTALNRTFSLAVDKSKSIGGFQGTNISRREVSWNIVTIPLNMDSINLEEYTIFLESVMEGQLFTFDPKGSIAQPVYPVSCYIVENSFSEEREEGEYYKLSFSIVQL